MRPTVRCWDAFGPAIPVLTISSIPMRAFSSRLACNEIMEAQGHEEPVGHAKLTPAFNLPCDSILHTVGPVEPARCEEQTAGFWRTVTVPVWNWLWKIRLPRLHFAVSRRGILFPKQERAAEIAVETAVGFLKQNESVRQVIFDVYTDQDLVIYQKLLEQER